VPCPPRGASVQIEPCASVLTRGESEVKRVLVTVEFVLRNDNRLHNMTEHELAIEIRGLFEDEHHGEADASVMALMAKEV